MAADWTNVHTTTYTWISLSHAKGRDDPRIITNDNLWEIRFILQHTCMLQKNATR